MERKERYELRRSISEKRAEAYRSLWFLCDKIGANQRKQRAKELNDWYQKGGGLFLSWKASQRYFSAMKAMRQDSVTEDHLKEIDDHLSWLRSEMKHHVGSYTFFEKRKKFRDTSDVTEHPPAAV